MDKERKREYDRQWYQRNKKSILARAKIRYMENKEAAINYQKLYQKEYYRQHRDKIIKRVSEYQRINPDVHREADRRYRERNIEKERNRSKRNYNLEKQREWRELNRDKLNEYYRIRYRTNIQHMLVVRLRTRLRSLLNLTKTQRTTRIMDLVGCTTEELVAHIETQFKSGMSWENRQLWHIDHIRPCSSFDLTNIEDQSKCFHWSNLQPLWIKDNLRKGKKYENSD